MPDADAEEFMGAAEKVRKLLPATTRPSLKPKIPGQDH
jgi:hypothetical protein